MSWHLTHHVRTRYRMFYPSASDSDVYDAVRASDAALAEEVYPLLGRRGVHDSATGSYRVHPDRTGVFVVQDDVVVTFLRFYSMAQRAVARRLWGGGLAEDPRDLPEMQGPSAAELQVSAGVARRFGTSCDARAWVCRNGSVDGAGYRGSIDGSESWQVPERVWLHEDGPIGQIGDRLVTVTPHRVRPELGETPVGPAVALRFTDLAAEQLGRPARGTSAEVRAWNATARHAVELGDWTRDDRGWRVLTQEMDGTRRSVVVVEREPGIWVVGMDWPPDTATRRERRAAELLRASGWRAIPPPWEAR